MLTNPYEHVPMAENVQPETLAADFRRDFPLSFKFSQGDVGVQRSFDVIAADVYAHQYTPEGFRSALPEALEQAGEIAERLQPPKNHQIRDPQEIIGERQKQWNTFSGAMQARAAGGPMMLSTFWRHMRYLNFGVQYRDFRFVGIGRRQADGQRFYNSQYRQYVMEAEPTISEPFNVVFRAMRRQLLRRPVLAPFYGCLWGAWDYRHADEPFRSEAFKEALRTEGTPYARLMLNTKGLGYHMAKLLLPSVDRKLAHAAQKHAEGKE
ncbi:MAG TPA: hypothetical protein VJR27_03110 [Candidatus Saccharimonadales bacterium]|nr:hypothetical protein [Candidatus Saccharimonadales bacterium]